MMSDIPKENDAQGLDYPWRNCAHELDNSWFALEFDNSNGELDNSNGELDTSI
jgi:hypothetical protein